MRLVDADAMILAQFYDEEHEEWEMRELSVADYLGYSDTAIPFVDEKNVVDNFCKQRNLIVVDAEELYSLRHQIDVGLKNIKDKLKGLGYEID